MTGICEKVHSLFICLPLLYNFMDSLKGLDFLNHEVKDLDEIRNSKSLSRMQPLTIPMYMVDITNRWQHPFLMNLSIFLHIALQRATVTELERIQKMKTVFTCCINLFFFRFTQPSKAVTPKTTITAWRDHRAGTRRTDFSPSSAIAHSVWERQLNFPEHLLHQFCDLLNHLFPFHKH